MFPVEQASRPGERDWAEFHDAFPVQVGHMY